MRDIYKEKIKMALEVHFFRRFCNSFTLMFYEENFDIDNVDVQTTDSSEIEDDTVLIEEDNDIDPAIDAGIKSNEEKEDL